MRMLFETTKKMYFELGAEVVLEEDTEQWATKLLSRIPLGFEVKKLATGL
jgi:hypothetical protein